MIEYSNLESLKFLSRLGKRACTKQNSQNPCVLCNEQLLGYRDGGNIPNLLNQGHDKIQPTDC